MTEARKRRRFGISLKMLLLIVLTCGLWLSWKANMAHEQRRAIEAIRSHGGQVFFDWNQDALFNGSNSVGTRPSAPRWAKRLLGDEYFQEIAIVDFGFGFAFSAIHKDVPVPDDDLLARLRRQPHIKMLLIMNASEVTDDGLSSFRSRKGLEVVAIHRAKKITDRGLAHLLTSPRLRSLTLSESKITPKGFRALMNLKALEDLNLETPPLREDQSDSLLVLTDRDLDAIRDDSNLSTLHLPPSQITDRGVESFRRAKKLDFLSLEACRVTDGGLETLGAFPKLKTLWITDCPGVTKAGIVKLREARPDLDVFWGWDEQGNPK